ncbi:glycoside hydrolase family 15 protein [Tardisphaera saccharovorans]
MQRAARLVVALVVIGLVVTASLVVLRRGGNHFLGYTRYPDFLLLSNWCNETAWISTGNEDPYFPGYNLSVQSLYCGHYGLLPVKLYVLTGGKTSGAELNLRNEVLVNGSDGTTRFIFPPSSDQLDVSQDLLSGPVKVLFVEKTAYPVRYSMGQSALTLLTQPTITLYMPEGEFLASFSNGEFQVLAECPSSNATLGVVIGSSVPMGLAAVESLNAREVEAWLNSSRKPDLEGDLLSLYYRSLLLIKDDQNPYLGCFVASPSPPYFYAWVRDGSFSAMALADSGHMSSALKYWKWMASEIVSSGQQAGTWYTRYDFWTGSPDETAPTEYDSIGLFQLGVWQLYLGCGNASEVRPLIPAINSSLTWELRQVKSTGLVPEDASVWEDDHAYNFWTEAFDDIGIRDSAQLYSALGMKAGWVLLLSRMLNSSMAPFYGAQGFAQYALPSKSGLQAYEIPDSSLIAPIDYGYVSPTSPEAVATVTAAERYLTVKGGLARFLGDTYHYGWDSTGKMPPWIITTMFLAIYYEQVGNYTGALSLLEWCAAHQQGGLLPEAIDPNYGNPLPTTSPLTWSAAMYVIASLGYAPQ